jgi:hypothetical protein
MGARHGWQVSVERLCELAQCQSRQEPSLHVSMPVQEGCIHRSKAPYESPS